MTATLLVLRKDGLDKPWTYSVVFGELSREEKFNVARWGAAVKVDDAHANLPLDELRALYIAGLLG